MNLHVGLQSESTGEVFNAQYVLTAFSRAATRSCYTGDDTTLACSFQSTRTCGISKLLAKYESCGGACVGSLGPAGARQLFGAEIGLHRLEAGLEWDVKFAFEFEYGLDGV
jgi:hypothetical protein